MCRVQTCVFAFGQKREKQALMDTHSRPPLVIESLSSQVPKSHIDRLHTTQGAKRNGFGFYKSNTFVPPAWH